MIRLTAGCLALLLCSGCAIHLEKDASAGLRWGTEVAIFHNAPDDGAKAEIGLNAFGERNAEKYIDSKLAPADLPTVDAADLDLEVGDAPSPFLP